MHGRYLKLKSALFAIKILALSIRLFLSAICKGDSPRESLWLLNWRAVATGPSVDSTATLNLAFIATLDSKIQETL